MLRRERNRFFKWYYRVRDSILGREHFKKRMRDMERRCFVERIFIVTINLELQSCDVLAVLTKTIATHRRGLLGPSLLLSEPVLSLARAA